MGQATLASAITELVDQHVLKTCGPDTDQGVAAGKQWDSMQFVKEPRFNLYFDGKVLKKIDLRKYVQGTPTELMSC
jgi:hypothetical protein